MENSSIIGGGGTCRTWRFLRLTLSVLTSRYSTGDSERRDKGEDEELETTAGGTYRSYHAPLMAVEEPGKTSVFVVTVDPAEPAAVDLDGPKEKQVHAQRSFQDAQGR